MTNYFLEGSQKTNATMVSAPVRLGKFTYHIRYRKSGIMDFQTKCIDFSQLYNIFSGHPVVVVVVVKEKINDD